MEGPEEQTHFVKRVVLPSGKTIDVVYFRDTEQPPSAEPVDAAVEAQPEPASPEPEADQDLHLCDDCESELVHPVEWEESGPENWKVFLQCPNCSACREGVFSQETVDAFDEELDRGAEALARDYKRLMRANMAEETDRFVAALQANAILPEDF